MRILGVIPFFKLQNKNLFCRMKKVLPQKCKKGINPKIGRLCFVKINSALFFNYMFGSCFRTLAVILASDVMIEVTSPGQFFQGLTHLKQPYRMNRLSYAISVGNFGAAVCFVVLVK